MTEPKRLPVVTDSRIAMIEKFQCPGCTNGSDTSSCTAFRLEEAKLGGGFRCKSHIAGTFTLNGTIALGLPKGFDKVGALPTTYSENEAHTNIRLWIGVGAVPKWTHLNVPVWWMTKDGFTFVRTYLPRLNVAYVDVIAGELTITDVLGRMKSFAPFDVGEFLEEID